MLEVLQFYVSGTLDILGITIGLSVVAGGLAGLIRITFNRVR